ncbi:MAG: alpha/beta hydrolase [Acidobacteria bacterium]|nr:alpha/beta hydrolase [Acidobacteriota bacterium]
MGLSRMTMMPVTARGKLERIAKPLLYGGAAVLALDLARRIFRHTQLFCPTREPVVSWNPADYGIPPDRVDEHWFESEDGSLLHAWYCRAPKPVASALYCHGNTGNLTNTAHVMPHLMDAGINVLLFDYRGFGKSSGHPSLHGVISDGIAAARFHETIRPAGAPSILYGFSLGGAIAAQVIRHHPFDGLILQSTFTNLPEMARAAFPHLPLHLFSGALFDTLAVIRGLDVPLLIIHGSDDEVCPKSMAQKLYEVCGVTKKMLFLVEGGLHKDLYVRDADTLVWAVNRFAAELPRGRRHVVEPVPFLDHLIDSAFRYVRHHFRRAEAQKTL